MAKIELKGVVKDVTDVTTVGQNNTKKQSVILTVAGFRDTFGEQRSPDEDWNLEILGDRIEKLNVQKSAIGHKAECTVYVSSRPFTKDGKTLYFIGANLAEIKLHGKASVAPVELPNAGNNTDDTDLPF